MDSLGKARLICCNLEMAFYLLCIRYKKMVIKEFITNSVFLAAKITKQFMNSLCEAISGFAKPCFCHVKKLSVLSHLIFSMFHYKFLQPKGSVAAFELKCMR